MRSKSSFDVTSFLNRKFQMRRSWNFCHKIYIYIYNGFPVFSSIFPMYFYITKFLPAFSQFAPVNPDVQQHCAVPLTMFTKQVPLFWHVIPSHGLAEIWKTNMEVNEIPYANCAICSSLLTYVFPCLLHYTGNGNQIVLLRWFDTISFFFFFLFHFCDDIQ